MHWLFLSATNWRFLSASEWRFLPGVNKSYKGLENTVIILTDIESFSSDKLMYVGLSRACSGLFLLISEAAKREYDDILIRRLLK